MQGTGLPKRSAKASTAPLAPGLLPRPQTSDAVGRFGSRREAKLSSQQLPPTARPYSPSLSARGSPPEDSRAGLEAAQSGLFLSRSLSGSQVAEVSHSIIANFLASRGTQLAQDSESLEQYLERTLERVLELHTQSVSRIFEERLRRELIRRDRATQEAKLMATTLGLDASVKAHRLQEVQQTGARERSSLEEALAELKRENARLRQRNDALLEAQQEAHKETELRMQQLQRDLSREKQQAERQRKLAEQRLREDVLALQAQLTKLRRAPGGMEAGDSRKKAPSASQKIGSLAGGWMDEAGERASSPAEEDGACYSDSEATTGVKRRRERPRPPQPLPRQQLTPVPIDASQFMDSVFASNTPTTSGMPLRHVSGLSPQLLLLLNSSRESLPEDVERRLRVLLATDSAPSGASRPGTAKADARAQTSHLERRTQRVHAHQPFSASLQLQGLARQVKQPARAVTPPVPAQDVETKDSPEGSWAQELSASIRGALLELSAPNPERPSSAHADGLPSGDRPAPASTAERALSRVLRATADMLESGGKGSNTCERLGILLLRLAQDSSAQRSLQSDMDSSPTPSLAQQPADAMKPLDLTARAPTPPLSEPPLIRRPSSQPSSNSALAPDVGAAATTLSASMSTSGPFAESTIKFPTLSTPLPLAPSRSPSAMGFDRSHSEMSVACPSEETTTSFKGDATPEELLSAVLGVRKGKQARKRDRTVPTFTRARSVISELSQPPSQPERQRMEQSVRSCLEVTIRSAQAAAMQVLRSESKETNAAARVHQEALRRMEVRAEVLLSRLMFLAGHFLQAYQVLEALQSRLEAAREEQEVLSSELLQSQQQMEERADSLQQSAEQRFDELISEIKQKDVELQRLSDMVADKQRVEATLAKAQARIVDVDEQVVQLTNHALNTAKENERLHEREVKLVREVADAKRRADEIMVVTKERICGLRKRIIVRSVWFRSQVLRLERMLSVSAEFDGFLRSQLSCGGCLDVMLQPTLLTPCGHTVCGRCIRQMREQDESERVLLCVECRAPCERTTANSTVEGILNRYSWWTSIMKDTQREVRRTLASEKDSSLALGTVRELVQLPSHLEEPPPSHAQ